MSSLSAIRSGLLNALGEQGQAMCWEAIESAPRDGRPVLAKCRDGDAFYICSVVYWTVDLLALHAPILGQWKEGDEYWCQSNGDYAVDPVEWLKGFDMPQDVGIVV